MVIKPKLLFHLLNAVYFTFLHIIRAEFSNLWPFSEIPEDVYGVKFYDVLIYHIYHDFNVEKVRNKKFFFSFS